MSVSDKTCPKCMKTVSDSSLVMKCSVCDKSYHLGKCSGVTEAAAKNKTEAFFATWNCPQCYSSRLRGSGNDRTDSDIFAVLIAIQAKLEKMESLPEKVDNIEKSISMMSDKYDEVLNVMSRHDAELKELRKRVEAVESRSDTEEVEVLKRTVNDLEYRSCRQNIVIHGITESQNEDLLCKVNEVAQSVGLPDLLPSDAKQNPRYHSTLCSPGYARQLAAKK